MKGVRMEAQYSIITLNDIVTVDDNYNEKMLTMFKKN
jgi:hypothetical protein